MRRQFLPTAFVPKLLATICSAASRVVSYNLSFAYHHHQPDYTHCRAKASPMSLQLTLSFVSCRHCIPANFLISSAHLTFCRPLLRLLSLGIHSVTLKDQRLSCLRITCPAQASRHK
uniref:Putative secreted protein n=1 Tax=Amblyomma cajennense TaxID=34607 RepID=A0A023FDX8_AMBCJ